MSFTITQVATSDTFQIWLDQTNKAINAVSTVCMTVNTHANGALTTGNGWIEGIVGSTTLVANTLRGGTVQTANVLTISSNAVFSGIITLGDFIVNSTVLTINTYSIAGATGVITFTTTTTGTGAQQIDFFDKIAFRGAEYVVTAKDNNANAVQVTKFLVVHDSGNGYMTEFGDVFSNTDLASYSCNANSTHIRMFVTPVSTNSRISGTRLTVVV